MTGKVEARAPGAPLRLRDLLSNWVRPHLHGLELVLVLMLVQSAATLMQPWVAGLLTDRVLFSQGFGGMLWLLFGLITAQATLGYLIALQLQKVSGHMVATASGDLQAHLQSLPLAWHQERQRGDVLTLLTGDIQRLSRYVTGTVVPLLPLLFTFFGALVMMLRLATPIAIAIIVLMPLMFIVLKVLGRWLRPLGYASMQAWADQTAKAEQGLEMLPVVKVFATSSLENRLYRETAEATRAADLRQVRLQGAITPAVHVVGAGVVLLLLGVAGRQIVGGEMEPGQLVSVFLYGLVLVNPVSRLAQVYGDTQAVRGTVRRLQDVLAARPEEDSGDRTEIPRDAGIHYQGIDFAYPGRPLLFHGFDLEVSAGETIALTGVNGAGKSTLAHLLLRLVEPQAGRITIGGIDVREFSLDALRSQIGLVSQHVLLFNATVADNISYGSTNRSQADIENAARAARAHAFVMGLPNGYDTVVGDQGVKLSGGQKQRLALARALLRDPPILILDEATAMFDPDGEREFIEESRELLRQRTVLLITHRPASLALADRVIRIG